MVKWFLALVLILGLVFAAGLRIDFKVLGEKLQKKPDHNIEALLKMGIDPRQVGYKGKPWWTFNAGDNLFKQILKWDLVKQMSDEVWETSQKMKKARGPSPAEIVGSQAMHAAAQARLYQQRAEARLRDAQQGPRGTSAASRGAEETET